MQALAKEHIDKLDVVVFQIRQVGSRIPLAVDCPSYRRISSIFPSI